MSERQAAFQITDEKGVRGTIDLTIVPPRGREFKLVLVRFDDGSQVFADVGTFTEQSEGEFTFPGIFKKIIEQNQSEKYCAEHCGEQTQVVMPLLEEQLNITRQKVLTGGVRVYKTLEERSETIDEPTLREDVEVERVSVNQFIETPASVRREGDLMIIPLMEEVLIVEKRLVLREEIRIRTLSTVEHNPQQYDVRREHAALERIEPNAAGAKLKTDANPDDK